MALVVEAHGGTTSGSGPSLLNVAYTNPVADGIIVLNVVSQSSPSGPIAVSSITDVDGLTWTLRSTNDFQGGAGNDTFCTTEIWWAYQPAVRTGGGNLITINWAAPTGSAVATWLSVSGCTDFGDPWDPNGSLPAWTSNPTNSSVAPTDTFDTTTGGALVFGVKSQVTFLSGETVDSPFTVLDDVGTGVGAYYCFNTDVSEVFATAQSGTAISFPTARTNWGLMTDALAGDERPATLSFAQIIG